MFLRGARTIMVGVELHAEDKSILKREGKKFSRQESGIRTVTFSMKMFSLPKLDAVARSVARIREEVAQLFDADSTN
jgi:hypothetical protein